MDIIKDISIIFMSIFFEALPFLLLGSILSAIIERYISNERIASLIPKNIITGSLVGVLLGFFLPACDCAVIPVSKRLIKKKVPLNVAVSFMLASPIINPVVLLSTYYAFYNTNPKIFWLRLILGIIISLIIGIIMGALFKSNIITKNIEEDTCGCHHDDCCHHNEKRCLKNDDNMTVSSIVSIWNSYNEIIQLINDSGNQQLADTVKESFQKYLPKPNKEI